MTPLTVRVEFPVSHALNISAPAPMHPQNRVLHWVCITVEMSGIDALKVFKLALLYKTGC